MILDCPAVSRQTMIFVLPSSRQQPSARKLGQTDADLVEEMMARGEVPVDQRTRTGSDSGRGRGGIDREPRKGGSGRGSIG
jgi:hypothetical protein